MSIQILQPAFATFQLRRSVAEASAPASTRRIEVLRTLAAIEAIEDDWRALEAATPEATGFQSYDWCRAWIQAATQTDPCWRIVAVRDGAHLVALWPLECSRFLGARVVRWLGEPWTQYGDVLVADDRFRRNHLAAAWREIASWTDVDLVKLGRVRADAALSALPGFTAQTIIHREWAPFVDLVRPRPGASKGLRARGRKLEAMGSVRFEIVTASGARLACVKQAVAFKEAWLRSRGLPSTGLSHASLGALMASLADSDTLVIGRLTVGDEVAALELGLRTNGAFRSLLGSHDERFARGSPGHQLIGHMADWCRSKGLKTYDLMVPADDYKRQWSNDEIVVADHLISMRVRGQLAATWFRSRPRLKRLYLQLPEQLRQLVSSGLSRRP